MRFAKDRNAGWTGTMLRLLLFIGLMGAYAAYIIPITTELGLVEWTTLNSILAYIVIWILSEIFYRVIVRNLISRGKSYAR